MTKQNDTNRQLNLDSYVLRHLRFGWWSLLVFLVLGIVLELLHGFKIRWYLDVANETRRLMWTLAHAHGVLLGIVNIGLAATWALVPTAARQRQGMISICLMSAGVLLPGGFALGGIFIYGGDPGIGIFLVPVGAFFLCVGVLLMALSLMPLRPADAARADGAKK